MISNVAKINKVELVCICLHLLQRRKTTANSLLCYNHL